MTVGSIVHELLQIVLRHGLKTLAEIAEASNRLLYQPQTASALYASEMSNDEMKTELGKFHGKIFNFVEEFVNGKVVAADKDVSIG